MLVASAVFAVPGAAYAADPATKVSAAGMAAELKAVFTTSTVAARKGWSSWTTCATRA